MIKTPAVIDASAVQMVLAVLTGWVDRQERQAVPTKNSISANPGLATGFWKPLAVRVNERRGFSF